MKAQNLFILSVRALAGITVTGQLGTQLRRNETKGIIVQSYLESLNYLSFAAKMSGFTVDLISKFKCSEITPVSSVQYLGALTHSLRNIKLESA